MAEVKLLPDFLCVSIRHSLDIDMAWDEVNFFARFADLEGAKLVAQMRARPREFAESMKPSDWARLREHRPHVWFAAREAIQLN